MNIQCKECAGAGGDWVLGEDGEEWLDCRHCDGTGEVESRTCDACRHWRPEDYGGICGHPKISGKHDDDSAVPPASREGIGPNELWTGPKFGCVHWEAKS